MRQMQPREGREQAATVKNRFSVHAARARTCPWPGLVVNSTKVPCQGTITNTTCKLVRTALKGPRKLLFSVPLL